MSTYSEFYGCSLGHAPWEGHAPRKVCRGDCARTDLISATFFSVDDGGGWQTVTTSAPILLEHGTLADYTPLIRLDSFIHYLPVETQGVYFAERGTYHIRVRGFLNVGEDGAKARVRLALVRPPFSLESLERYSLANFDVYGSGTFSMKVTVGVRAGDFIYNIVEMGEPSAQVRDLTFVAVRVGDGDLLSDSDWEPFLMD